MMKNKKLVKGIAAAAIAAMSMGMLAGCGGGNDKQEEKTYKVGLVQYVQHGSLDEANDGMIAGLADSGFVVGENLEIDSQNAQGDQSNLQSIAQQYLSAEVDLIMAIATPAAQVMAAATSDIPIVGTAITSYEEAGLVESDEAPGTNVTGTHDMTPIAEQIDLILQVVPEAKTIGTIYTSSEANSIVQIEMLRDVCADKGLTLVERTISNVNDIQQAAQSLVEEGIDAVWLATDNNVASAMPNVVGITDEAGLITVCGANSMVTDGGTLTYGINYYAIGYDAGVMAAQILKGEAVPAEMAVQAPKVENMDLIVNVEAIEYMGIELPADMMERATLVNAEEVTE